MSEEDYLKCSCRICGGHIEFPSRGKGLTVECPHCGRRTDLYEDSATTGTSLSRFGRRVGSKSPIIAVSVSLAVVSAITLALRSSWMQEKFRFRSHSTPAEATNIQDVLLVSPASDQLEQSISGCKVGPIRLEPATNTGLVYAVGTLRNELNRRRYGVRVELDLYDDGGNKTGTASDYLRILEPGQEGQFRALLPDPKSTKVSIAAIKESN